MAKEFEIQKASGACIACGKQLIEGEEFSAALRQSGEELRREDYCSACQTSVPAADNADVLGIWKTRLPRREEKKKLFVDNDVLINFFERLEGSQEPAKINFRFVIALILMRKKLLVYEGMAKQPDGTELWKMWFKGSGSVSEVVNPQMDDEKITHVSENLSEILQGEL